MRKPEAAITSHYTLNFISQKKYLWTSQYVVFILIFMIACHIATKHRTVVAVCMATMFTGRSASGLGLDTLHETPWARQTGHKVTWFQCGCWNWDHIARYRICVWIAYGISPNQNWKRKIWLHGICVVSTALKTDLSHIWEREKKIRFVPFLPAVWTSNSVNRPCWC